MSLTHEAHFPSDLPERVASVEAKVEGVQKRQDNTDEAVVRLDSRIFKLLIGTLAILVTTAANLVVALIKH